MHKILLLAACALFVDDAPFTLNAKRKKETAPASGQWTVVEETLRWQPSQTALIICDMWDKHTCKNATRRVGEMVPRLNALVRAARKAGAFIIHAPSDTMKFYEGTPQRELAQKAPEAKPPEPIQSRRLDTSREAPYPIDDSDWCDDETPCPMGKPYPWTREHPEIDMAQVDAVSEKGQEMYNLFAQRGIKNVLMTGVHTNMCVLGRSFGIRQMTRVGMNVVLVRDLTDCLYNPKKKPFVSHDEGTALMIEHIEKYWCPSILSSDVIGVQKEK